MLLLTTGIFFGDLALGEIGTGAFLGSLLADLGELALVSLGEKENFLLLGDEGDLEPFLRAGLRGTGGFLGETTVG